MKYLRALIATYSLFVVLWFAAYLIVPDQWWPLILLNKLAYFFLVVAIPVFIVALLSWKKSTVGLALLPVLVFAYFYAPFLIPNNAIEKNAPSLRVMTYNIWNQNKDIDSILKVINTAAPDVVAVQELMVDIQEEFVENMAISYPYYHVSPEVYGGTTAIFSKHDFTNVIEVDFKIDRPAIAVDIIIGDKAVTVIGAHLYPSYYSYHDRPVSEMPKAIGQYIKDQQSQIKLLVDLIKSTSDIPVVLACDCNVQRTSSSRLLLEEVLTDSAVTLGWSLADQMPAGAKYEHNIDHIDYIWYAGPVRPMGLYRSIDAGGSDHAPIFADLFIH